MSSFVAVSRAAAAILLLNFFVNGAIISSNVEFYKFDDLDNEMEKTTFTDYMKLYDENQCCTYMQNSDLIRFDVDLPPTSSSRSVWVSVSVNHTSFAGVSVDLITEYYINGVKVLPVYNFFTLACSAQSTPTGDEEVIHFKCETKPGFPFHHLEIKAPNSAICGVYMSMGNLTELAMERWENDTITEEAVEDPIVFDTSATYCQSDEVTTNLTTDSCYRLVTEAASFDDASAACLADYGGRLVVMETAYEERVVEELIKQNLSSQCRGADVWFGIVKMPRSLNWVYENNGRAIVNKSTNRGFKYKNNKNKPIKECASLVKIGRSGGFYWDRRSCSEKKWYVCEMPKCPNNGNWHRYNTSCFTYSRDDSTSYMLTKAQRCMKLDDLAPESRIVTPDIYETSEYFHNTLILKTPPSTAKFETWSGNNHLETFNTYRWVATDLLEGFGRRDDICEFVQCDSREHLSGCPDNLLFAYYPLTKEFQGRDVTGNGYHGVVGAGVNFVAAELNGEEIEIADFSNSSDAHILVTLGDGRKILNGLDELSVSFYFKMSYDLDDSDWATIIQFGSRLSDDSSSTDGRTMFQVKGSTYRLIAANPNGVKITGAITGLTGGSWVATYFHYVPSTGTIKIQTPSFTVSTTVTGVDFSIGHEMMIGSANIGQLYCLRIWTETRTIAESYAGCATHTFGAYLYTSGAWQRNTYSGTNYSPEECMEMCNTIGNWKSQCRGINYDSDDGECTLVMRTKDEMPVYYDQLNSLTHYVAKCHTSRYRGNWDYESSATRVGTAGERCGFTYSGSVGTTYELHDISCAGSYRSVCEIRRCPVGFVSKGESCYMFPRIKANYTFARRYCNDRGADSIFIETQDEFDEIEAMLIESDGPAMKWSAGVVEYWTSGYRPNVDESFRWAPTGRYFTGGRPKNLALHHPLYTAGAIATYHYAYRLVDGEHDSAECSSVGTDADGYAWVMIDLLKPQWIQSFGITRHSSFAQGHLTFRVSNATDADNYDSYELCMRHIFDVAKYNDGEGDMSIIKCRYNIYGSKVWMRRETGTSNLYPCEVQVYGPHPGRWRFREPVRDPYKHCVSLGLEKQVANGLKMTYSNGAPCSRKKQVACKFVARAR